MSKADRERAAKKQFVATCRTRQNEIRFQRLIAEFQATYYAAVEEYVEKYRESCEE